MAVLSMVIDNYIKILEDVKLEDIKKLPKMLGSNVCYLTTGTAFAEVSEGNYNVYGIEKGRTNIALLEELSSKA